MLDFTDSGITNDAMADGTDVLSSGVVSALKNKAVQPSQLVVVDAGIEDYAQLLEGVIANAAVLVLDSNKDGIVQIDDAMSAFGSLEALHIVSHGTAGQVQLGSTQLSSDNLIFYEDTLERWDDVLTDTADILLYGCNVAKGSVGSMFVEWLSSLTGADVAASNNWTGSKELNGDWTLEVAIGQVESGLAFQNDTINGFEGVLFQDSAFRDELLVSSLNQPTAAAELPDGSIIIVQKNGELLISSPQNGWASTPYLTIPNVSSAGERGALEIALHPDFESNGYFYIYSSRSPGGGTNRRFQISRFTHTQHNGIASVNPNSELMVWEDSDSYGDVTAHFGGGLDFGPDGMLYLTTADEFDRNQSQILSQAGGKIIRLNVDGADSGGAWVRGGDNSHLIPSDNPSFVGVDADPTTPGFQTDYLPEIWAYGLRNPYRASWDTPTNRFFIAEVGGNDQQTAREDVHIGEAGGNFGWPYFEGISGDPNISDPIYSYSHTGQTGSVGDATGEAIIGGVVYRGDQLPQQYNGAYFFTDFVQGWVRYLAFDANNNAIDADPTTPEVDAFDLAPAGSVKNVSFIDQLDDGSLIYLSLFSDGFGPGQLRRISYDSGNAAPVITQAEASVSSGPGTLTVDFTATATDTESDPLVYTWDFGDGFQSNGQNVSHDYTANGIFNAVLTVADAENVTRSEQIQISVGYAPEASIALPTSENLFRAGDTINFSGSAIDQDGTLSASNFSWTAELLHNGAIHPRFSIEMAENGSFTIPTTGLDYSGDTGYLLTLRVTDSDGLTDVESITLRPEKVDLTFNSSNVPGGVEFILDAVPKSEGFTIDTAVNFEHTLVAPERVLGTDGNHYDFAGWSTGEISRTLTFNVPDNDQTYTANYVLSHFGSGELSITSGLVLQLDADTAVATTNGVVTGWADQSGYGNDLVSSSGDPRLVANALNGHSVVQFDGSGDQLFRDGDFAGLPERNADRTVFMVAQYEGGVYGGFAYGKGQSNKTFGLTVDGEGDLSVSGWGHANDQATDVQAVGAGWLTQSVVLEAGVVDHYQNGGLIDSQSHTFNTRLSRVMLGAEIGGGLAMDMDVAEVLVYDRALTEAERQQVEAYLQAKYFGGTTNPPAPNVAPVATDDSATVATGSSVDVSVLSNDSDRDGALNVSSVAVVNQPANGTLVVSPTGTITYIHDGSATASDTFTYTVSDNEGTVSNEATVSLIVNTAGNSPNMGGNTLVTSGLVLQLDADTAVATTNGVVTGWADQSGYGNDLVSSSGDPRLVANALNGHSVVQFDGSGDQLFRDGDFAGLPERNADRTVFMVAQYEGGVYGGFAYGKGQSNKTFGLTVDGEGDLSVSGWGHANDQATDVQAVGAGWLTQSVVLEAGVVDHYQNGGLIDSQSHTFNTRLSRVMLGAEIGGGLAMDMDVAEVLVYDRALTEAERQQVEAYLQAKYFGA